MSDRNLVQPRPQTRPFPPAPENNQFAEAVLPIPRKLPQMPELPAREPASHQAAGITFRPAGIQEAGVETLLKSLPAKSPAIYQVEVANKAVEGLTYKMTIEKHSDNHMSIRRDWVFHTAYNETLIFKRENANSPWQMSCVEQRKEGYVGFDAKHIDQLAKDPIGNSATECLRRINENVSKIKVLDQSNK